jgi:hypothetical protein
MSAFGLKSGVVAYRAWLHAAKKTGSEQAQLKNALDIAMVFVASYAYP